MHSSHLSTEVLLLGTLSHAANAMIPARPERYRAVGLAHEQAMPTVFVELLDEVDLRRREDSSTHVTITVTMAPDETCGYLSGEAGAAITCENNELCSWEVKMLDAVGCGGILHTSCVPLTEFTDASSCNDVCQSNTWNLLCTETNKPFCRTYDFPDGVRDYRCASTSVEDVQSVEFTYRGQDDAGFSTTVISDGPQTTEEEETGSSTRPTVTVTYDDTPGETSTAPPGPPKPHKDSNIGPIVGGAVGGLLVIALLIFGIFFFLRRSRKRKEAAAGAAAPAPGYGPPAPAQQMQQPYDQVMVMTPEVKQTMVSSHNPADWRQSTVSPVNGPISPVSQAGWQGNSFPAPAYQTPGYETKGPVQQETFEAPGHEAREAEPIYEIGDGSGSRK
ncbi:hypothetical protein QQX98_007344 [Neonectria punicea]|uniref:Uncharacterized protein n=1 Tax=Neonectria punicea TaxID=979145 RepID=A0ABR1GYR3_9HYPO